MTEETKFLTPAQLVQRWNNSVSLQTLNNWRHKKKGPDFQKVGTRVLYPLAKVIAWEEAKTVAVNDNGRVGAKHG